VSDADAIYRLLKREGSRGVHTLDLRRQGYSGNPSQRKADIEEKYGVQIESVREPRDGRNGSRYRLVGVGTGEEEESAVAVGPSHHWLDAASAHPGEDAGTRATRSGSGPASARLFDLAPSAYDPFSEAA
jgi:hypothetical protein